MKTLVILVTLICAYVACWGPTKKSGVEDVGLRSLRDQGFSPAEGNWASSWMLMFVDASPVMPLVVGVTPISAGVQRRVYYFWFFGYVAKLPYERDLDKFGVIRSKLPPYSMK